MAESEEENQVLGGTEAPNKRQKALAEQKEKRDLQSGAIKALRGEYAKIATTPAFLDLVKQIQVFADYHTKIGKDGRGFIERKGSDGSVTQVEVSFSREERITHMDKATGIEEILGYIERRLA